MKCWKQMVLGDMHVYILYLYYFGEISFERLWRNMLILRKGLSFNHEMFSWWYMVRFTCIFLVSTKNLFFINFKNTGLSRAFAEKINTRDTSPPSFRDFLWTPAFSRLAWLMDGLKSLVSRKCVLQYLADNTVRLMSLMREK